MQQKTAAHQLQSASSNLDTHVLPITSHHDVQSSVFPAALSAYLVIVSGQVASYHSLVPHQDILQDKYRFKVCCCQHQCHAICGVGSMMLPLQDLKAVHIKVAVSILCSHL